MVTVHMEDVNYDGLLRIYLTPMIMLNVLTCTFVNAMLFSASIACHG